MISYGTFELLCYEADRRGDLRSPIIFINTDNHVYMVRHNYIIVNEYIFINRVKFLYLVFNNCSGLRQATTGRPYGNVGQYWLSVIYANCDKICSVLRIVVIFQPVRLSSLLFHGIYFTAQTGCCRASYRIRSLRAALRACPARRPCRPS